MTELPDKSHFLIGEVARIVGVKPHVLRFWEQEFPDLKPRKNRSQRRVYTKADIALILQIYDLLYRQKYTIPGAREQLRSGDLSVQNSTQNPRLSPELRADLQEIQKELEGILQWVEE